jgi:hypothetical protein
MHSVRMPWQPPAEARLLAAKRVRVLSHVVFAMFAFVVVMGIVVVVGDPSFWWQWLIVLAPFGFLVVRTAQRLRAVDRALPGIEAEIRHQANTSPRAQRDR